MLLERRLRSEPDPALVRFADDLELAGGTGEFAVGRINPSADPEAFLAQTAVMRVFETQGNALPAGGARG